MSKDAEAGARFSLLKSYAMLAVLALLGFASALDNGFISDDFVILERVESLVRNPLYLFSIPPEAFRTLTYVFFLAARKAFGYSPAAFYLVTVLVQALNALLLGLLVQRVSRHPNFPSSRAATLAGLFFLFFERPQEAFLWLSASNELFLGTFLLLFLLCWLSGRRGWGVLFYGLALFSKESALVGLLLLPIVEMAAGKRPRWHRESALLGLLSLGYCLLLVFSRDANSLLQGGFYDLSPGAVPVLFWSTHRLALPWLYLFGGLTLALRTRVAPSLRWWLLWLVIAQLPYIFLTYQDRLPSRHQYLAAMGLCAALALMAGLLPGSGLRLALAALFVAGNAGYSWVRKDPQYELRAAPTTALIQYQHEHPPGPLILEGFPLNPAIARLTTRMVEGWSPDMIRISEEGESCPTCPVLAWDPEGNRYRQESPSPRE